MYLSAYNFYHPQCMNMFSNFDALKKYLLKYNLQQHADSLALQLAPITLVLSSFIMQNLPYYTYVCTRF